MPGVRRVVAPVLPQRATVDVMRLFRLPAIVATAALAIVPLTVSATAVATDPPQPQANDRPVRAMSFNIHHGVGIDDRLDLQRIADVVNTEDADIVGLQEVDRYWSARSDFVDQASWLARALNMHVVYGANLDLDPSTPDAPRRQYCTAILSDAPILEWDNTYLPRFAGHELLSGLGGGGGLADQVGDRAGLGEVDRVARGHPDHGGVGPLGHRWAGGGIIRSSVATRYQLGLDRQAGLLTVPPRASSPHDTWELAMNSACAGSRSPANDSANVSLSRARKPLRGGRMGGTGAPGGGSAMRVWTDSPWSGANAAM